MKTEDRDATVRILIQQMREKLATSSPETQEYVNSCVLSLSRLVDSLMQVPVCGDPKASTAMIDLAHLIPEGQGPEMTVEQIKWQEMQPVWQPILDCLRGDAP